MVSQNSHSSTSASGILHQFIISDQTHFQNHQFEPYRSNLRGENTFHHHHQHPLGPLPTMNEATQDDQLSHHTRHLMDLLGATTTNDTNNQQQQHQNHAQRLSLSLNSQQMLYNQQSLNPNLICSQQQLVGNDAFPYLGGNNSFGSESFVGNSRYLKPAQCLLEEIVNCGAKYIGDSSYDKFIGRFSNGTRHALELSSELKDLCSSGFFGADKQDLQIRISKLVSLLEEVESRYEKYYNQMEEVSSAFEMIVGLGSAKTYTSLALQAMSRHFCNLRDAILAEVNVAKRKFVQDLPKLSNGLSQLSLFDQENRHNRMSLQQLGLIQNQRQAWRPIRGLPETSVSILRSWLFEHFLHPYPNDSEKLTLASQTGLSKNQVSNWFINARVRLWKPMIEEMYKEEFADSSSMESDQCIATTYNVMASTDQSDD